MKRSPSEKLKLCGLTCGITCGTNRSNLRGLCFISIVVARYFLRYAKG